MRLYPKVIPAIAREVIQTLTREGDIEVETLRIADAEMDMAAIMREYLAAEERVNQATKEKDASAFCLLIQPSAIEETFVDIDRCVQETKQILKQAGDQPTLEVESVEVDGDLAQVTFTGTASNEATFVREGGRWYVPIDQSDVKAGTDSES